MHTYQIIEQGQAVDKATKALIFLHGRGGSAEDILRLADAEFYDDSFYIAAPQATNNSWYPYSFMVDEKLNEPWLSSAISVIKKLIDETAKHIPKNKIYVLGFSQGACLALEATARFATKYGGIIAFSGGLIGSTINESNYNGNFEGTNVFIGNSDIDPHIPLLRTKESAAIMENLGANVTLKIYPGMAHTINSDEINWAKKIIESST